MPGNEIAVCEFLVSRLRRLNLHHLGLLESIEIPGGISLKTVGDCVLVHPDNSCKKADIMLNGAGVSIKQIGGSFSFNRLQRSYLESLFSRLDISDGAQIISILDKLVLEFHEGKRKRDVRWEDVFISERNFLKLLRYLMLIGSPSHGDSAYPAKYILEAPKTDISSHNIRLFGFMEYYKEYSTKYRVSIRRQWVGQDSSENRRAISISKVPGNRKWVFDDVVGAPRSGWSKNVSPDERKTVYFLMISKTK